MIGFDGGWSITRDKEGLNEARQLQQEIDEIIAFLEAEELPDKLDDAAWDRIARRG
jgi:hypothetical protein